MRFALLACFSVAAMFGQQATVNGKLVLDSSQIAKKLYGRIPVFHGTTTVKNMGPATVQIGGADINLALSTMPTISSSEGTALANQAYQKQTPQKVANIVTLIASGVGLASGAGSVIKIGVSTLSWLLFGVSFGQQGLLPFFSAGNPPMPTFNPCDQLNVALAAGMTLTCDEWIEKPAKGATPLPSVVTFDLESVPPPAPLPVTPPPVQLKRKQAALEVPITVHPEAYTVTAPPTLKALQPEELPIEINAQTVNYGWEPVKFTPVTITSAIAQELTPVIKQPTNREESEAFNTLGRASLYQGKIEEAIRELRRATLLDSTFAQAKNALGFALYLHHDYTEAISEFDKAIAIDANYKNAITNRNLAARALQRTQM